MKRKPKRRPVKPIGIDSILTVNSPKMHGKTEFAFEAAGTKYYNFKADTEVRYGRYVILQAFLQEYNLRTDLESLKENIKALKGFLNPQIKPDGSAQLQTGKACELLEIMDQRANIAFEPDTVYRLASCLFVDDQEVLSTYDREHNDEKITLWKKTGTVDFFFHKLFIESTRLKITSKTDLENYLRQAPELLKGWSSVKDILLR